MLKNTNPNPLTTEHRSANMNSRHRLLSFFGLLIKYLIVSELSYGKLTYTSRVANRKNAPTRSVDANLKKNFGWTGLPYFCHSIESTSPANLDSVYILI
jgi:hypothetical protein